jgi:protein SCO1/2
MRYLILLFSVFLAACGPEPKFHAADLSGVTWGKDFALTDHYGKHRTLADFRGKTVIIFFGYTQCPDVCPTNLSTLREVMNTLGPDAERVQMLFVTVDPERDTQELLAQYVAAFHPGFIGLYGDAATTVATAKDFKVFYVKQPGSTPTTYTVDHTAGSYVIDSHGKLRLYIKHGETPGRIADDLRLLLAEP